MESCYSLYSRGGVRGSNELQELRQEASRKAPCRSDPLSGNGHRYLPRLHRWCCGLAYGIFAVVQRIDDRMADSHTDTMASRATTRRSGHNRNPRVQGLTEPRQLNSPHVISMRRVLSIFPPRWKWALLAFAFYVGVFSIGFRLT